MAESCDFCVVYTDNCKLYIKGSTYSCQETSQSLTLIQWSPPKKIEIITSRSYLYNYPWGWSGVLYGG